jgi:integrase
MAKGRGPVRFTDTALRALKPGPDRYELFEGNGFGVRVTPAGSISFIYVYHHKGRPRRLTLGRYADPREGTPGPGMLSLADARVAFTQAAAMVERGLDPAAEGIAIKAANRAALTFEALAQRWIDEYAKPKKRSWEEDERLLKSLILPKWRNRVAKEIKRADVIALLDGIVKHAPVSANRVLSLLSKLFNWAIPRELVEHNPCSAVEKPTKEQARERALSDAEVWRFWLALPTAGMIEDTRNALRLVLATAQRPGEVVGAKKAERSGEGWIIPGERTKNGRAHYVPLSKLARQIWDRQASRHSESDLLFPGRRSSKREAPTHMTRRALSHAMRNNLADLGVEDAHPHDLRRTASSKMTELLSANAAELGAARFIVGKVLNHADPSITGIYDVYSYAREKRTALGTWGEWLARLAGRNSPPDDTPLDQ